MLDNRMILLDIIDMMILENSKATLLDGDKVIDSLLDLRGIVRDMEKV
jgi:hypothetical protein